MEELKNITIDFTHHLPNPIVVNDKVLKKCSKISVELDTCEMTVKAIDEVHGNIEAHCDNWRVRDVNICLNENKGVQPLFSE